MPVLALLALSGCTLPGGTTTAGNGVVIKEFGPEFSEIYSKEPINFRLLVKNEGSVDALNVHAELLGLDEDWCGESQTRAKCERSEGNRLEMMPNEEYCQYKGDGFRLLAPDPQRGTSGSQQICTWTYNAPPLDQGFTITYTPSLRTFYTYKSGVVKLITFGSSNELRNIQDSGGKLPTETVSSTSSPVQLTIETKGPIRFWPEENSVIFPLEITIRNTGGGIACADNDLEYYPKAAKENRCKVQAGEESKNKVRIKISFGSDTIGFVEDECAGFTEGETVSLWKGQSNTIVCDVVASDLSSGGTMQRMITAEAVYDYYTDVQTSITVIGRKTATT